MSESYDPEVEIRELNRCLAGIRHWLKVAAEYKATPASGLGQTGIISEVDRVDTLQRQINGIQAALVKAAEYEPRRQQKGRRHG